MLSDFIDMKGAADLTGYSLHTLYKKVERGEIPFRKLGRRNIFLKDELLGWMNGSPLSEEVEIDPVAADLYDSLQNLKGLVEGLEAAGTLFGRSAQLVSELVESCLSGATELVGPKYSKEK
ncbi:helix-turn-helix transcriptional regulator [candidate division KSB1 bacterium]